MADPKHFQNTMTAKAYAILSHLAQSGSWAKTARYFGVTPDAIKERTFRQLRRAGYSGPKAIDQVQRVLIEMVL